MSEILDNQIITGELLNNIAADLGLPEFNKFGENKFGVDELNNITGDLTGKGILNIYEKCLPTIFGNTISIAPGIIVFDSGAKLRLTEPATFEIENTDMLYIYAVNDTVNNQVLITALYEPLTVGDYLLLCEIKEGTLYDKRLFSKSKVVALDGNLIQEEILSSPYIEKNTEALINSIQLLNPSATKVIGYIYSDEIYVTADDVIGFFVYDSLENRYITFETYSTNKLKQSNKILTDQEYGLRVEEDVWIRLELYAGVLNVYAKTGANYGGQPRSYKIIIV